MSDYALRERDKIERLVKMIGQGGKCDPLEGRGTQQMDILRGMGVPLELAYARRRHSNFIPDLSDVGPEILQAYVTGHLCCYEKVTNAYLATCPPMKPLARELRRFSAWVAQGILIGHKLNSDRIAKICKMAGVNHRAFALDVADALDWMYEQADGAARRYCASAGSPTAKST